MNVIFAERARRDISDIYDSIAQHNPDAAQRVEDAIRAACEGAGDLPYAAAVTDEPNVRRMPLARYPYTIFYRVDAALGQVEIARVIHGARVRSLRRLPDRD